MKKIYYTYNPDTDNFERVFPSVKRLVVSAAKYALAGILIGGILFFSAIYVFETPNEEYLRKENSELKAQYRLLNQRVEEALSVMNDIATRDDNFYRAAMQAHPVNQELRHSSMPDRSLSGDLANLSNTQLTSEISKRIGLLERQVYVQSKSFDELKTIASEMGAKVKRIPSSIPLRSSSFNISSGYGYRRDPVRGTVKLHRGIDFAVPIGTPVYATGDGKVKISGRNAVSGTFVEIAHGNDYSSFYCHLSDVSVVDNKDVKKGDIIGYSGTTGKSSAPHLHYEVRYKDMPQNPVDYFFSDLNPEQYDQMLKLTENAGNALD